MKAYYNEHDKRAAAWLRELIRGGHIADGDVDERSIADVQPSDLLPYGQCHFFAGIGGWSLACRLAGIPDDFPIWTGSCPCQPFSSAGLGLGERDPRHLWPELRRLIAECSPAICAGEQVASKAGRKWLARVRADLEALGYGVGAVDTCAASQGAPHIRQRLYWLAYSEDGRWEGAADTGLSGGRIDAERGGAVGGMDDCIGDRRNALGDYDRSYERQFISSASIACGMGDSERERRAGQSLAVLGPVHQSDRLGIANGTGRDSGRTPAETARYGSTAESAGNPWDSFEFLPCTDGKARRIEPGTFPLADGIPGRVGLLRGYGNAIVPSVAADFLTTSLEALMEVLA